MMFVFPLPLGAVFIIGLYRLLPRGTIPFIGLLIFLEALARRVAAGAVADAGVALTFCALFGCLLYLRVRR